MRKLVILTYHSIDNSDSVVSISPILFSQHLRFLKEHHFEVLTLSKGLKLLKGHNSLDKKIVLTFDDGYENFHSHAFPLLSQYRFPATVFLVSGYCGRDNNWPGQGKIPIQRLMNWSEIEKLSRAGIEFGAHSENHPDLTSIPLDRAEAEIADSRNSIQDRIGADVTLFAYPYGHSNASVREIVRKEYEAAVGTNLSATTDREDPYNLSRVDAYYIARHFELVDSALLTPYLAIRNMARQIYHRSTKK